LSGFYQSMETVNSIPFVGKTVTYSFYARAGANYSPTSSALAARVYSGTGTDQSVFTYTGSASVINTTMTLTSTWQRFTATGTVATSATELAVGFEWSPTGTAGAADYFEVTGVQLDIGNVALPYRAAGTTYQQELAACQRYYYRPATAQYISLTEAAGAFSTTQTYLTIPLKVTMRANPTAIDTGGTLKLTDTVNEYTATAIVLDIANAQRPLIKVDVASGLTQFRPYNLNTRADGNAYLGISAEL